MKPSASLAPRVGRAYSLRARLFVALFFTGIATQLVVVAFSWLERPVFGRMQRATDAATGEAREAAKEPRPEAALRRIAEKYGARVRLYDASNRLVLDADFDREPPDAVRTLERFLVATATPAEVTEMENWRGPPPNRQEYMVGRARGTFVDCDLDSFIFCQGIGTVLPDRPFVVHVQKSSLRAVGPVYALRQRLLRLTIFTVPLSILVAYFLARRLHKPLSALRDATLEKATAAHAVADLPEDEGEVGQVGHSFNVLLRALDDRRKATSAFMADAVHEVKNPVAAMKAAAESLAAGTASPERQQRIARIVEDSAKKLDRLVTELLDLSRAEAGMPGEERTSVDVSALAKAVCESIAADERFARVKVTMSAPPKASAGADGAADAFVNAVASRLEAVLRELVTNGASFCEEDGGEVKVAISTSNAHVTIDVTDTGPGIDADALAHIFDRFFTTRGDKKGTGLGLAMVKAVVEAHGGKISAALPARFSIDLPRTRA